MAGGMAAARLLRGGPPRGGALEVAGSSDAPRHRVAHLDVGDDSVRRALAAVIFRVSPPNHVARVASHRAPRRAPSARCAAGSRVRATRESPRPNAAVGACHRARSEAAREARNTKERRRGSSEGSTHASSAAASSAATGASDAPATPAAAAAATASIVTGISNDDDDYVSSNRSVGVKKLSRHVIPVEYWIPSTSVWTESAQLSLSRAKTKLYIDIEDNSSSGLNNIGRRGSSSSRCY